MQSYYPASKLLKRRDAETRVEPFAIDRDRLEFGEGRATGNFVALVAFVSLEFAQLQPLGIALQEIGVVIRVLRRDQNYVNIRPIRRLEVGQAQDQLTVLFLVDRGPA